MKPATEKLLAWLKQHATDGVIGRRNTQQGGPIRDSRELDIAITELAEHGVARLGYADRTVIIELTATDTELATPQGEHQMSDRTEFDEVKNRYQQHQHLVAAAAGCRQQAEGHAGIVAHAADARAALVALYADQAAGLKVSTKELDKAIAALREADALAEITQLAAEGALLAAARFENDAADLVPRLNASEVLRLRELFDPFHQCSIWELALIEAAPPGTLVPHCQPPQSFYEGKLQ